MIPYIYQNDLNFPVPIRASELDLYAFLVKGEGAKLQATIDRYLNNKSDQHQYRVFGSHLLITYSSMLVRCLPQPYVDYGKSFESGEVTFWVPLIEYKKVLGAWMPVRFALFVPYILLDNPTGLTAGRDSYGMPKQWGWVEMPRHVDENHTFKLDTLALKTYAPDSLVQREHLLTIQGPGEPAHVETWDTPLQTLEAIRKVVLPEVPLADHPGLPADIFSRIHVEVPIVTFKQFREPSGRDEACYQAILNIPATVQLEHFRGKLFGGTYTLSYETLQSHPLANDLGLVQGPVSLAFYVNFMMEMGAGTPIWSRSNAPSAVPQAKLPTGLNFWQRLWWAFFPNQGQK